MRKNPYPDWSISARPMVAISETVMPGGRAPAQEGHVSFFRRKWEDSCSIRLWQTDHLVPISLGKEDSLRKLELVGLFVEDRPGEYIGRNTEGFVYLSIFESGVGCKAWVNKPDAKERIIRALELHP